MLKRLLPAWIARALHRAIVQFVAVMGCFTCTIGTVLYIIYAQYSALEPTARPFIAITLWVVFFALLLLCGVAAWLLVRAHDVRRAAQREWPRKPRC